ncbi:MAG: hypothetical protein RL095_3997 [Verrucomicrobiota bacterium]|jgi:acyl-CoA thioesterase FadM
MKGPGSRTHVLVKEVEFSHTDLAGIAHFSNFGRFMEAAEHLFLRTAGVPVVDRIDALTHAGFPRFEVNVKHELPLRFGDMVELRLQVTRLRPGGIEYRVEFHLPAGRAAVGTMKCGYCRFVDGAIQVAPIPEAHFRRLAEAAGIDPD